MDDIIGSSLTGILRIIAWGGTVIDFCPQQPEFFPPIVVSYLLLILVDSVR